MKKAIMGLVALICALGASAENKRYTNVLDKIPAEGYVGFAALEFNAPGLFQDLSTDIGVTTTHGWMVTPKIFLGAGVGFLYNPGAEKGLIPIFAEAKFYFPSQYMRKIYPHIDARLGGQIATEGGTGLYSQLGIGFRVPVSEKLAINVEVGPQMAGKYVRGGGSNADNQPILYAQPFKAKGTKVSFFGRVSIEF